MIRECNNMYSEHVYVPMVHTVAERRLLCQDILLNNLAAMLQQGLVDP